MSENVWKCQSNNDWRQNISIPTYNTEGVRTPYSWFQGAYRKAILSEEHACDENMFYLVAEHLHATEIND